MGHHQRIRGGTIVAIVAAFGVITALFFGFFVQRLGIFGVAQATPSTKQNVAHPMPTPPAGYAYFRSADGLFGVNVATSWHKQSTTQAAIVTYTFAAPDTLEYARISEARQPLVPNDLDSYLQTAAASANGTDYHITEQAHTYPVGNNAWWRAQGAFTVAGIPQRIIGFAMNYQGIGMLMFYTAPSANYHVLVGAPFTEMVKSFTYLR